jgi:carbon monoxide dehydrogenase subunit G
MRLIGVGATHKGLPRALQSPFQRAFEGLSGAAGPLKAARVTRRQAMAMTMTGEVQLPASRNMVWAKLNDPEVLKVCIPGCEELNKNSDTEFQAVAVTKIGPVKARFKGKVHLTDLDPPNGYKISGEGDGGVAGFAKGGAMVALSEKDGGTLLTYNVEAQIGGKLAQLGQRLVNGAAKKIADEFFKNFAAQVAPPGA